MKTSAFMPRIFVGCWSCLCVLVVSVSLAVPQQKEPKPFEDPDEYAVYSAVLTTKYFREGLKQFVIAINTTSGTKSTFIGWRTGLAPSGAKRPEVDPDTSADFDRKFKDAYLLANQFSLTIPYALVTEEELLKIFHEDAQGKLDSECWHRFYQKYPGTHGILAFSRVGFNSKKDQALLYVANQSGFVGGSGVYFVLSKHQNSWSVETSVILWLS